MNYLLLANLWIGRASAAAGFLTLVAAMYGIWRQRNRSSGRESGSGAGFLRWQIQFIAAGFYLVFCILLWHTIPVKLSLLNSLVLSLIGCLFYFPGLCLYCWGFFTLGKMFSASSGFGARLFADHQLVIHGPFAIIRHPMYLGVMAAGLGALIIYKTWAMLFFAVNMFFLALRARREEQVLAEEFPQEWKEYSQHVPAWLPRIGSRKKER